MKSHLRLLQTVLKDRENLSTSGCTSTIRDMKTLTERVEHEGLSFLTITLPQFGKDLERSLAEERVARTSFVGFAKNGYLPRLFSGFTSLIFDSGTGQLIDEPSIDAIRTVRQVCYLFGKTYLPCSDARNQAAFDGYVNCERELKLADQSIDYDEFRRAQRIAMLVFGDALSVVDRRIYEGNLIPKHGPGATADRLRGNSKFELREWTERLQEVFEHSEYLFPSVSHFLESPAVEFTEPGAERPVRVITVPKTLKTPRIIAIEPSCMQYMQQAILRELVPQLERRDFLSSSFVGFSDQAPNRRMARSGSRSGRLATLDLSEASDRVSNQLVRFLFSPFSWFSRGLDVTRSRKADVPGHGIIRLAKYASMGSALCFPIEAMVFTTLVFLGIERELSRPLTTEDIKFFRGKVRVYGDDIIVPVDCVHAVVSTLQDFGLVVNENKSFWTGKFRESCGKEYFAGHDVSVVKARRMLPTHRQHVPEIVSAVSFSNQLRAAYYPETVEFMDEWLQRFIPLPAVLSTSQGLGRHMDDRRFDVDSMCPRLQRPLVRAAVVHDRLPLSHLEGAGALLKWFLYDGDEPLAKDHLERAGRPDSSYLKVRKVCPY